MISFWKRNTQSIRSSPKGLTHSGVRGASNGICVKSGGSISFLSYSRETNGNIIYNGFLPHSHFSRFRLIPFLPHSLSLLLLFFFSLPLFLLLNKSLPPFFLSPFIFFPNRLHCSTASFFHLILVLFTHSQHYFSLSFSVTSKVLPKFVFIVYQFEKLPTGKTNASLFPDTIEEKLCLWANLNNLKYKKIIFRCGTSSLMAKNQIPH